ncbi:RNA polymerase sigma factor [Alteribacillus bidgolensis]|uniref:RNA polymerase sigma-70 factor, ECF subfamily n=1 Tax=Alteribacillus bidgolensis TaxID=930129 RepID=A0A1G8QLT5_9BACI|nr:sigma-70 family RNA polymerase sigma factor [Alteribacillus bidgolensis]SDJ05060.1 RNA polymerase sigma-70 factor, ECF subfamily [Alteribacillus bidgolensis]
MNEESDYLLDQIKQGSRKAFDQFYERHKQFIFQIAYHFLKNRIEAEDICHDVFIEIFQNPSEYRSDKGSMKAWLAVKTKSRCLDYIKKKKPILKDKMEDVLNNQCEATAVTEVNVLSRVEREIVTQAMANLPEEQRTVLYGAYYKGQTQREMAKRMKRPLGTIKSLVRYGLNNLRKQKILHRWADSNGGEKKNE